MNLSDGIIGDHLTTFTASMVNISGGTIGNNASFASGSRGTISGGTIGYGIEVFHDTQLDLMVQSLSIGGTPVDLTSGETVLIT